MKQCKSCGISLPINASFCGNCGYVMSEASERGTSLSNRSEVFPGPGENNPTLLTSPTKISFPGEISQEATVILPNWLNSLPPNSQPYRPVTPLPATEEEEEKKRRRAALLLAGLPALDLLGNQQPQGYVPTVQGVPQIESVPTVSGTPQVQGGMIGNQAFNPVTPSIPNGPGPTFNPSPINYAPYNPPSSPPYNPPSSPYKPPRQPSGPPKKPTGGPSGCLVAGTITLATILIILAALSGLSLTILAPNISLSGSSEVNPGGMLSLQGDHFLPDSSVSLSLDGNTPIYSVQNATPVQQAYSSDVAQLAYSQSALTGSNVSVNKNGTFTLNLPVDPSWPLGHHVIDATESVTHRSASLPFTIQTGIGQTTPTPTATPTMTPGQTPTPTPKVSPTPTPTPTSKTGLSCATPGTITLGPVTAGSSQVLTKDLELCTTGSGVVNWSASLSPQVSWLQLNPSSGSITAPATAPVTISASAATLAAGTYNTSITFIDQTNHVETISVSLSVEAECVTALPGTLNFTGVAGVSNPSGSQTISVTNCGLTNQWSGSISVGSGGNWLSLSSSSGTLASGATQNIQATAANLRANLSAGSYHDTVTIKIGSKTARVTVNLTVKAPPPPPPALISVSPTSYSNTTSSTECTSSVNGGDSVCPVTLSNSSATQSLAWTATTSVSSASVTARSHTIAAGGQESATIEISFNDCNTNGTPVTVTFTGPANSATFTWTCTLSQIQ
jgi:hypothetical protein